jgi:hypothetical protein
MRKLKARRTPTSVYPAQPPEIPGSLEVSYHAINNVLLDSSISEFKDRIVTSQILYKPALLASARIVFEGTRWEIYHERDVTRIIPFPNDAQMADWDKVLLNGWENAQSRPSAEGICFYEADGSHDFSQERIDALQEEFKQYLVTTETFELVYNPHLKLCKKLDETDEQFFQRCLDQVRIEYDQEKRTLEETILRQEERFKEKLEREVRQHGENPLENQPSAPPVRGRQKRVNKQATISHQEEIDVQGSRVNREDIQRQLSELQIAKAAKLTEFEEGLTALARQRQKDLFRLNSSNVRILRFSLVWLPFTELIIQDQDQRRVEQIKSF